MKKIVFRNFRYLYCDDFALFLQEMSEKGWHFSRWGIGLEFEKGQPEKRIYHVEVFQNASELDLKAEYDTNEYGDYCEAAGWKFLDSRRKFCIFRKERMDAPDIVTAEERFSIIRRAELSWRLWEIAGLMLCFALNFWQVWTNNFVNSIFDNLALMVSAILIFFLHFESLHVCGLTFVFLKMPAS